MEVNYKYSIRSSDIDMPSKIGAYFHYKDAYRKTKKFRYPLGLSILPELWDKNNQKPTRDKKLIRKHLRQNPHLEIEIQNILTRMQKIERITKEWFANKELQNDEEYNLKELKSYLDQKVKKQKSEDKVNTYPIYMDELLRLFTDGIETQKIRYRGKPYAKGTIRTYKTTTKNWLDFQNQQKKRYSLLDIDTEVISDWSNYCFSDKKTKQENGKIKITKGMSVNSLGKENKNIKSAISYHLDQLMEVIYKSKVQNKEPFITEIQLVRIEKAMKGFKVNKTETTQIALSDKDLDTLHNLQTLPDHLIKYRDIFLVGCYTALRISDYTRLSPEHIDGRYIKIRTAKSPKLVTIPMRPELHNILKKYDFKIPIVQEQKLNQHIKDVCKIAGMLENIEVTKNVGGKDITTLQPKYSMVKSHTARRTAATLMYYSGIPPRDIMTITGHSKLSTFMNYIRVSDEDVLQRLENSQFFKGSTKLVVA